MSEQVNKNQPYGGWGWWSENSAYRCGDHTMVSYVGNETVVLDYNHVTGVCTETGTGSIGHDDHNDGAFLERQDGRIIHFYARHNVDSLLRWRISTNPCDGTSWGPQQTLTLPGLITYVQPHMLPDGRIIVFYRLSNLKWQYAISTDQGNTFSVGPDVWLGNSSQQPYIITEQDPTNPFVICVAGIPANPGQGNQNVYAWQVDFSQSPPVYSRPDGSVFAGPATIADVTGSSVVDTVTGSFVERMFEIEHFNGNMVVLIQRIDVPVEQNQYLVRCWNGTSWDSSSIINAGQMIDPGFSGRYSGQATFEHGDPTTIYAGIEGANGVFNIQKFEASHPCGSWSNTEQCSDATSGLGAYRPLVTENAVAGQALDVLWMEGPYDSFSTYTANICTKRLQDELPTKFYGQEHNCC